MGPAKRLGVYQMIQIAQLFECRGGIFPKKNHLPRGQMA